MAEKKTTKRSSSANTRKAPRAKTRTAAEGVSLPPPTASSAVSPTAGTEPSEAWPLEERLRDLRRIFSTPFTEVEGTDLHQGIGRYGAVMPCKLKALELYSRLVGDLKGRGAASGVEAAGDDEEGDDLTRLLEGIVQ